jgi:FkbM family methyltransferase
MSFQHRLRLGLRRVGIDMARYPSSDPMFGVVRLLAHFGIDCVIDVGANSGGFASTIRGLGYSGRIVSLEPLSGPSELLEARAAKDPAWEVLRIAAGDKDCEIKINVAGNAGASSSVLAMLDTHADAAPESRYVDTEVVSQRRLDGLLPELGIGPAHPAFLKLDVQGYEAAVLDGAVELFDTGAIMGLHRTAGVLRPAGGRFRPLNFALVVPDGKLRSVETSNGEFSVCAARTGPQVGRNRRLVLIRRGWRARTSLGHIVVICLLWWASHLAHAPSSRLSGVSFPGRGR